MLLAQQVLLVRKVHKVMLVLQVQLDHKVQQALLVFKVIQVQQAQLDHKVRKEILVL